VLTSGSDTASTFAESDLSLTTNGTTVDGETIVPSPNGSVDRSGDNDKYPDTDSRYGLEIETKRQLGSLTVTVSDNTADESRVYITDTENNVITSEPSPGAGNSVTLSASLSADTRYYVTVDAEGGTYDAGYYDSATSFPYESEVLTVVQGVSPPNTTYAIYAPTIRRIEGGTFGTAVAEWPQPGSVRRWETAAFQTEGDGETAEVYVETNDGSESNSRERTARTILG